MNHIPEVSIKEARKVLGSDEQKYSDADIENMLDLAYCLAKVLYKNYVSEGNKIFKLEITND